MSHYVMVDGVLQKSSPETKRWARRAAKQVPQSEEQDEPRALWYTEDNEEEPEEEL